MKNIYNVLEENSILYELMMKNEEDIINEQNDIIEWQTACYMEDLVLEQMMYEDFNEEKIETLIEGTLKERLREGAVKIKLLINRFIDWMEDVLIKFSKKMNVYKEIFDRYGRSNIHKAIKESEVRVKIIDINGAGDVMEYLDYLIGYFAKIVRGGQPALTGTPEAFKNEVFREMKIESIDNLKSKLIGMYVKGDKPVEKQIKDLNPSIIIGWLEGDALKIMNNDFRALKRDFGAIKLNYNMASDKKENPVVQNIVSNCSFLISILRSILSVTITYNIKVTNVCKSIVLRVVGKTDKEMRPDKDERKNDEGRYWNY